MSDTKTTLTKVYAFCNSGDGTKWQMWMAIAETGEVIAQHCSSSRLWGIYDVGPVRKRSAYESVLGEDFKIEYVVLDDGQGPPAEVVERNRRLGELAALKEKETV